LTRFSSRSRALEGTDTGPDLFQVAASDADLLSSVARGNRDAVATLYDRHGALIYRYSLRMSGDVSIAEEVTQEVFLAMLRQANQFDPRRGLLSTWLCAIARRLVWKQLRNRQRLVPLDIDDGPEQSTSMADNPDLLLTRKQAVELVRKGMDALPLQMKEVIILCEFEEMTYDDAAVVLDVPVGTVRSRLHRARARLAQVLEGASQSPRKESSAL
jgi:RNA polymerase sigma-70 factor (ECF subfamily)